MNQADTSPNAESQDAESQPTVKLDPSGSPTQRRTRTTRTTKPADSEQAPVSAQADTSPESSASEPPPAAPAPPPLAPVTAAENQPASDSDDVVAEMDWYILKVAFNREESIADALRKRVKMEGMDEFFGEIVVPTEDVATFTRDGKRRISKRKLLPGYIMVNMIINDDTWFLGA